MLDSSKMINTTLVYAEEEEGEEGCYGTGIGPTLVIAYVSLAAGVILILENLLLITVVARTKSLHTNTFALVASLAITDVLVGVECCLTALVSLLEDILTPPNPRVFDSIITGVNHGLLPVSMCHLAALALDRYLHVCWPFKYARRVTRRRVTLTAATIWILGVVYMLLPVTLFREARYHVNCILLNAPVAYSMVPLSTVYLLCLCVMFCSTLGLVRIALEHRRRRVLAGTNFKKRLSIGRTRTRSYSLADRRRRKDGGVAADKNTCTNGKACAKETAPTCGNNAVAAISCGAASLATPYLVITLYGCDSCLAVFKNQRSEPTNDVGSVGGQAAFGPSDLMKRSYSDRSFSIAAANAYTKVTNESTLAVVTVQEDNVRPDVNDEAVASSLSNVTIRSDPESTHVTSPRNSQDLESRFTNFDINSHSTETRDGRHRLLSKANLKIIKFVLVVLGCSLLCTFPAILILIIDDLIDASIFSDTIEQAMGLLLVTNSAMNFLILFYMNQDFRAALIGIVLCRKRC